jgi:hypothetical protein
MNKHVVLPEPEDVREGILVIDTTVRWCTLPFSLDPPAADGFYEWMLLASAPLGGWDWPGKKGL